MLFVTVEQILRRPVESPQAEKAAKTGRIGGYPVTVIGTFFIAGDTCRCKVARRRPASLDCRTLALLKSIADTDPSFDRRCRLMWERWN